MKVNYDYVIVGAGPAGLQLGYYMQQAGKNYIILERGQPGEFFAEFPRHRKLISINKVHTGFQDDEVNLRWDWNSLLTAEGRDPFSAFSQDYFPHADSMVAYLRKFRDHHGIAVRENSEVSAILREQSGLVVETTQGERIGGRCVIIATGLSVPNMPAVEGAEYIEPYTSVSVDPQEFRDQRVLILGKGNSAFETADNLIGSAALVHVAGPNPLRMAWKTHFVGDLRAVNNNFLDTYQLKSQNALLNGSIDRIRRQDGMLHVQVSYNNAEGEVEVLRYDRVIACTGFRFDDSILAPSTHPLKTACGRLPLMGADWEAPGCPGLYYAGTLMQMRDRKKYMSGFIHGFRYNVRTLWHILRERFDGVPYPASECPLTADALTDLIIARVNRTSALWQQPGFLCDSLAWSNGAESAQVLHELPVALAQQRFASGHHITLTLEFGSQHEGDPFSAGRVHKDNSRAADRSAFLHPILRHYLNGTLIGEHHIIEDLEADWREPEHVEPLRAFLRGRLDAFGRARLAAV